ncbi:NRDE protein-domain-containing protein [Phellopilus nigrolimitatus]|nr:NRDE protein-domain-containing protein [Phellopilus nigrolimitatus]
MCIGLWSLDHPEYAMILCSNRDEYLSRPTVDAHFHSFGRESDAPFALSGRDLQAGGSWFGINRAGRIALLTNITEQGGSYTSSRGHLVSSFLLPDAPDIEEFTKTLTNDPSALYAGFNLLLLSPSREANDVCLTYDGCLVTNSGGGGSITARRFRPEERRVGGVSNGIDGANEIAWPKVTKGEACLKELLYEQQSALSERELIDGLLDMLTWEPTEPPRNRSQLRTSIQIPPLRMTSSLSAGASADGPEWYGTRLSTVILVRRDGRVLFVEKDAWKLDPSGEGPIRGDPQSARVFRFRLNDTVNHEETQEL